MPGPAPSRPADRWVDEPSAARSPYDARPWLASYPDGVPDDFDFPQVPLTQLLDDATSSFPSSTALAFLGTRITYRELSSLVDRFATALAGLGVRQGDRVAIVLPNCPQNVITFFATLRLGAVVVQHNPLYTDAELRHQLADSGAKVVVCLDRVYDGIARVRSDTAVEHVVVTSLVDYLPRSSRLKLRLPLAKARRMRGELSAPLPKGAPAHQFLALLRRAGAPARQVPLDPTTDLALLQYTGGTTGLSKGAMLTHGNLVSNAYMNRLWDTGATAGKEVTLGVLPLFHAYGLTVCMNATVLLSGTLVLLPRFDLDQVFGAIDAWKPTMFPGVPPIYKALTDSAKAKSHDLRSIRVCVSGAMKLPGEIQEQFERISGARLVEGYGMTETSPSTHCNPLTGPRRAGSIGLPLPGTRCRVVDREDATREVPVGQAGELVIAGPQVFRGYWGRPDTDGVFTPDGYVLTGDIAVMDEDGYFTIVDRKKELIIAGGFNIYPSEVEEVLFRLPGVADAVVFGVPDRYRGETVKAYVVPQPGVTLTAEDVIAHCATDLTAFKVPKVVEFRDTLPRTAVGKVLRRVLVAEEQAKLEQNAEPRPGSVPGGFPRREAEPAATTPGGLEAARTERAMTSQDHEPADAERRVAELDDGGGDKPLESDDDGISSDDDVAESIDAHPDDSARRTSGRSSRPRKQAAKRSSPRPVKPAPPANAPRSVARPTAQVVGGRSVLAAPRLPGRDAGVTVPATGAPQSVGEPAEQAAAAQAAAKKAAAKKAAAKKAAAERAAARKAAAEQAAAEQAAAEQAAAEQAAAKKAAAKKAAAERAAAKKAAAEQAAAEQAAAEQAAAEQAAPKKAAPKKAAPKKPRPRPAPAVPARPGPPARVTAAPAPVGAATVRRAAPTNNPPPRKSTSARSR